MKTYVLWKEKNIYAFCLKQYTKIHADVNFFCYDVKGEEKKKIAWNFKMLKTQNVEC